MLVREHAVPDNVILTRNQLRFRMLKPVLSCLRSVEGQILARKGGHVRIWWQYPPCARAIEAAHRPTKDPVESLQINRIRCTGSQVYSPWREGIDGTEVRQDSIPKSTLLGSEQCPQR